MQKHDTFDIVPPFEMWPTESAKFLEFCVRQKAPKMTINPPKNSSCG